MGIRQPSAEPSCRSAAAVSAEMAHCVVEFDSVAEDFGQIRTLQLRNSAQIMQSVHFQRTHLTR